MASKYEMVDRRFKLWLRKWAKTSKPTEWISSVSTAVAIFGGIISGLYLLSSGFLAAKKDAADAQLARAEIRTSENNQLSIRLEAKNKEAEQKIAQASRELGEMRATLAGFDNEKKHLVKQIETYQQQSATNEVERVAILNLRQLTQKHSTDKPGEFPRITVIYSDDNKSCAIAILAQNITGNNKHNTPIEFSEKTVILEQLKKIKTLNALYIQGVRMNHSDLAVLHHVDLLHSLELVNCGLTDTILDQVTFPKDLWQIDLSHNPLSRMPPGGRNDLNSLNLASTSIDDEELQRLVRRYPKLHNLTLHDTKITESGCKPIEKLEEIETLSVPSQCVSDDSIWLLSKANDPQKVIGNVNLGGKTYALSGVLDLSNSRVTDNGLAKLSDLSKLSSKQRYSWLNISGTKITDKGLLSLAYMEGLNGLAAANSSITEDGLNKFLLEIAKRLDKTDYFFVHIDPIFYEKYKKNPLFDFYTNIFISKKILFTTE